MYPAPYITNVIANIKIPPIFTKLKTRSKPVECSSSNEDKFFDDECVVYKTAQSPKIWQCRLWIRDDKKYIRKSLTTVSLI